jgi:hypothetical protein
MHARSWQALPAYQLHVSSLSCCALQGFLLPFYHTSYWLGLVLDIWPAYLWRDPSMPGATPPFYNNWGNYTGSCLHRIMPAEAVGCQSCLQPKGSYYVLYEVQCCLTGGSGGSGLDSRQQSCHSMQRCHSCEYDTLVHEATCCISWSHPGSNGLPSTMIGADRDIINS